MSLLIKALRQAEKQNDQAAKRAAKVAIDLPPEAESSKTPVNTMPAVSPLDSALTLAVETQTSNGPTDDSPPTSASDFPTIDESFSPTIDRREETELAPEHNTKLDNSYALETEKHSALSLESVEALPNFQKEQVPREAFARHAPITPAPLAPAPDPVPEPTLEPAPEPVLEPNPTVEPSGPEQSNTEGAVSDAAPYLAVKSAFPKRRFTRKPLAVLIGLPLVAILLAVVTTAIVWWSGNQAYDVDFNAPTAQPLAKFATSGQPLSQLDLGLAVEGTGIAPDETVNPGADSFASDSVAPAAQTTSEPTSTTVPSAPPARTASTQSSPPIQQAPAIEAANNKTTASPPPVRRVLARQTLAPSAPPAAAKPALPAVRFIRSVSSSEQSQQLLNDAYQALQRNELEVAKTAYQQALRIDKNLIDGWVGLASIAARQRKQTLAMQHYQRALNIDPNDNVARTGLLALAGASLPEESESTLRTLIDSSQQNAMAELTLANTLARQGRWAEAQQAYFNANTSQPNQPDTVFNLAVSLERIRQPRAALRYYEQALALSQSRKALFDPELARLRINAIKQKIQEQ